MIRYLTRRIGQSVLTIFLTISTVFVLVRLAPGDPAAAYAPPSASPEELDRVREQLGLNESVLSQYWVFLRGLLHGLAPGLDHLEAIFERQGSGEDERCVLA